MIRKIFVDENENNLEIRLLNNNTLSIERIDNNTKQIIEKIRINKEELSYLIKLLRSEL